MCTKNLIGSFKEFVEAGGTLWTHSIGAGVLVEGKFVKGVVVMTPQGRGVVLCKNLIDATGNADLAILAGADYEFIDGKEFGFQGTGLSPLTPGIDYENSIGLLWMIWICLIAVEHTSWHVLSLKITGMWLSILILEKDVTLLGIII